MEQQETKIAKKDLIRKKTGYPGMEIHKSGEVEYLAFPALERLNIVTHMVTSRFGGVSTGDSLQQCRKQRLTRQQQLCMMKILRM